MFSPIGNKELLSTKVASSIEKAILTKQYNSGDKLPSENELSEQFQVSRTAVREALRTLSARGLITIEKGRGNFIKDISSDSVTDPLHFYLQMKSSRDHVLEIVHARQIIEPSIAAIAAVNHTSENFTTLCEDLNAIGQCQGDFTQLAILDMQFHLDVARAAQNSLLPLLLDPIYKLLPKIKSIIFETIGEASDSAVESHQRLLDAIASRSEDRARQAMIDHLRTAEEHAVRMLELTNKLTKEKP